MRSASAVPLARHFAFVSEDVSAGASLKGRFWLQVCLCWGEQKRKRKGSEEIGNWLAVEEGA